MPKFLIERRIPGAGRMSADELRSASEQSCNVLRNLAPEVQWQQSYVTDDTIHCVYIAPSADHIRQHAEQVGIPADNIMTVRSIIDPTTAEQRPSA